MHWYSQKHGGEPIEPLLSAIDSANVLYWVLHERSTERNQKCPIRQYSNNRQTELVEVKTYASNLKMRSRLMEAGLNGARFEQKNQGSTHNGIL